MNQSTKKVFKGLLVVFVIFGMLAFYISPLLAPAPTSQQVAPAATDTFTPPVGAPSVKGPTAPPGQ